VRLDFENFHLSTKKILKATIILNQICQQISMCSPRSWPPPRKQIFEAINDILIVYVELYLHPLGNANMAKEVDCRLKLGPRHGLCGVFVEPSAYTAEFLTARGQSDPAPPDPAKPCVGAMVSPAAVASDNDGGPHSGGQMKVALNDSNAAGCRLLARRDLEELPKWARAGLWQDAAAPEGRTIGWRHSFGPLSAAGLLAQGRSEGRHLEVLRFCSGRPDAIENLRAFPSLVSESALLLVAKLAL
jgi:hypothetical protein